jgi:glucosamine kinase
MKIIADSGSTKTAWRLVRENNQVTSLETNGINPYYQSLEEIIAFLTKDLLPLINEEVKSVHFYGAGCTGGKEDLVREAVSAVLQVALVEVNTDLLGASRSLCFNEPGIVCIMGTGSNSCYYDGKTIVRNIPPLGYILGDEGSAAVLGKKLVADYLKNLMPESLRILFEKDYQITVSEVLDKVYRQGFPNRYLSEFAPFLSRNIGNSYCEKLVVSDFQDFVRRNVLNYKESREVPVSFAGSVAYYFESQLKMVLQSNGLIVGRIVQHPIDSLVKFHCQGFIS